MQLVSVGSTRDVVNVYVTPDDGTEPQKLVLSHRVAISLARQLLSAVETYMPEEEA